MNVTPTTRVTILGGADGTSEWGDPVEGSETIKAGVPAAIHLQRRIVATENSTEARAVRFYTGYLPHGTAVSGANRLRDERSSVVYLIDAVDTPQHPGAPQDVQLDLRTVS